MINILKKLINIILGLAVGALLYFALWAVFVYFGIVS
tara:strand:+ start:570 stop:680 length:111 start_codon:yes stop_codon:yes gene_type:complete